MTLAVDQLCLGAIGTNCYIVRRDERATDAVVIDPGDDLDRILEALGRLDARCAAILLTHSHYDHIGALADLVDATNAPVWLPRGELDVFRRPNDFFGGLVGPIRGYEGEATLLVGGETIEAAEIGLEVTAVPGHSPGHLAYHADGHLFSGDVLFAGSVGRTDLPFGDWDQLLDSIRALADAYPPETLVHSGHGSDTTLGAELARNPFLAELRVVVSKIEPPRGTHDITPAEQPLWRRVTGEMERLCALYGYRPIQTPGFEDTDLFQRTSGEGSDVVQKEMYTFTDRSDRSLTLRPEGTAPICRAYLTHGLQQEPQPQKLYTIAPMYRYGRPGRGRHREHWQLSVEAIGTDDPALDAEVLHLYDTLLRNLGVTDYHLELNSIGDRNCRPAYLERLSVWLAEHVDELDGDTREKLAMSPLRALDNLAAKPAHVQEILAAAPAIGDSLCADCIDHFAQVRSYLDALGVAYTLVPTLVRGLDYYTRTTWEFVGPLDGANSVISGGGRYDGLIEEIGGPPTPGVGFGAGIERLLLALEDAGVTAEPPAIDVFLALEPDAPRELALRWLKELRAVGIAADTDYAGRSLKGQLTQAGRSGAYTTVIVGPSEAILRRQGAQDEPLAHADVIARLSE